MSSANNGITGVGLGLRRELMPQLPTEPDGRIDFLEIAPENWLGIGGRMGASLRQYTERYPFVTHGLSLSLGGPAPLDENFVRRIKAFLDQHGIATYTEHLSACSDDGHLYDLMPVPFTDEGVRWVAGRIRRVMDILERRIAVENVSYYASPLAQMSEQEFILAVLEEADCDLLLDVNNAYVNSTNHRYDAAEFIRAMPVERIRYLHIAGHYREAEDLIVDTHGADIVDPVWQLLHTAYDHAGVVPTLLERDFNLPPLMELLQETDRIRAIQCNREAANARAAS
jgi:hypothetical protein